MLVLQARGMAPNRKRKLKTMTITATPKSIRPHLEVAEIETVDGYRYWSEPMLHSALMGWLDAQLKPSAGGYHDSYLSDLDCAVGCWCDPLSR